MWWLFKKGPFFWKEDFFPCLNEQWHIEQHVKQIHGKLPSVGSGIKGSPKPSTGARTREP